MTFGSLFAGIGGMDLGLERAGFTCKFQVEIDPFARKVLAKHWPDVPRHDDVRTFPPTSPEDWHVDLVCGGFPCQDVSLAGKGAGLDGARSGLWFEYARVIRTLRPRFVLVENVPGLLVRGIDRVLGTLAEMGYDAEWGSVPAAAVGAPHLRDRVFIVAHDEGVGIMGGSPGAERTRRPGTDRSYREMAHPDRQRLAVRACFGADAREELSAFKRANRTGDGWWASEPDVVRMVHGIPARLVEDRIRGLGNAVVPQVAEWIGRMILMANTEVQHGQEMQRL